MSKTIITTIKNLLTSARPEISGNRQQVQDLISQLCETTGVTLHPDMFKDEDATLTVHGKAVSMTTAAQCAEDYMRTQVFLRGTYQAIQEQLQSQSTVELLYAGTGPFGLLVIPLLPFFSAEQIQVTLLDIHPESLEALGTLIDALQVRDHIRTIQCVDILQWQAPAKTQYDLIVSETMKAMLEQEPQVAIFTHLSRWLKPSGHLIPERIQINAWLCNQTGEPDQQYLGPVFSLDQQTACRLHAGDRSMLAAQLRIPEHPSQLRDIKFTTDITVYAGHRLTENQSSLTLPKRIKNANPLGGSRLKCRYHTGTYPKFRFHYRRAPCLAEQPLPDSSDTSLLGILHLKRMWHKAQLNKQQQLDKDLHRQEWPLDQHLLNALQLDSTKVLQLLYLSDTAEDFQTGLHACNPGLFTADRINHINQKIKQAPRVPHNTTQDN
ncbi:class I SAM-dependent methyltransferase [Marinobacterium arenosum]|uniref:class I SAM-dependent methyltransferase n=1 Tax=Marinobacterium arenosum TaxID=2862496 RepID=UPI001C94478C|nr:class I SAM-dependent methyltransferase [Marinobacterium arenosum]MBY4678831.1 class I SAM-dependent methyltransferase [Marinobacterium arenosum]